MYAVNVTQIKTLAAVRADVAATRIGLANYVISVSAEVKTAQKTNLANAQSSFATDVAAYRAHGGSAAATAQLRAAYARYVGALPALMAFGDAKNFTGYWAERTRNVAPAAAALDTALNARIASEDASAAAQARHIQQVYTSRRALLI